jgi:hypothetical protein
LRLLGYSALAADCIEAIVRNVVVYRIHCELSYTPSTRKGGAITENSMKSDKDTGCGRTELGGRSSWFVQKYNDGLSIVLLS